MIKHRGFPSRLPSSDFQFTIRRANKSGATRLKARARYADRRFADRRADEGFLEALIKQFGEEEFMRGNLDAGRMSWLLGREIMPIDPKFDPEDYDELFKINIAKAMVNFPDIFRKQSA